MRKLLWMLVAVAMLGGGVSAWAKDKTASGDKGKALTTVNGTIKVDGEKLNMEKSTIQNYSRWLDLKTGTLYRRLSWETSSGKQVEITWRRFMNPQDRFVCVQDVTVTPSQAAELTVESFIDNNVRTNGFDKFVDSSVKSLGDLIISEVITNRLNRVVTASQCFYTLPMLQQIEALSSRKITARVSFQL